ncbi:MAG: gluconate 2-dehydrogenase subunit 3 family protein [Janthinobacterium lividum]
MKKIQISPNRRAFLRTAVASAPAALVAGAGALSPVSVIARAAPAAPYRPTFFDAPTFSLLSALVDTLIPADDVGPGAVQAGVAEFIDRQMNTPYGHGELWYMQGPHHPEADAVFGYQLPYPPREIYRKALPNFDAAVHDAFGKRFEDLDEAGRTDAVTRLEKGALHLPDVPADTFFGQLIENVREGYFCDPVHGGNKDMASWRMVGFPGARADYYDWVDQYGKHYPLPPVSRG